jgi:3-deoxy-D-manno-octulosonic-acid transferase
MFLYSFAWLVVLVLTAPWWGWKMLTTGKYREGLRERLGVIPDRLLVASDARPVIWIHAVSVGEVIAISGLVRELRTRAAGYRVIVSTTTRTGQTIARERFSVGDVFYYPLDFGFAVRACLGALRPRLLVLAETEFWPRMLSECARSAVPVVVVNARISDRSYPRYMRLKAFWRPFFGAFALVLAQSGEDMARLKAIGIPAERVRPGGNLKYDIRATSEAAVTAAIRTALLPAAKLLVCGSTLEGEERMLLDAWPELVAKQPELRMVLAPRHPERFEPVAHLLAQSGIPWLRRSEWLLRPAPFPSSSILLLDSIGELASVYSLATVAFVGGSLVPAGGHNPLEPAQFGVPILLGPHYRNFREIVDRLKTKDAIEIVEPAGLAAGVLRLLDDRELASAIGGRAKEVFTAEAGATGRAVEALLALLPGAPA